MRRRLALGLSGLLLVPLLLDLGLRVGLLTPVVNLALGHLIGSKYPLRVQVGRLRSDIFSYVEADHLLVMAPARGTWLPLLTVDSLRLDYRGWMALRGRIGWAACVRRARVKGLNVFLLRDAGGDWNISALASLKTPVAAGPQPPLPLLSTRLELLDSQVVLVDQSRGFRAAIRHLEGTLDTRALPRVVYNFTGSTDGKRRRNFSVAGEMNRDSGTGDARVDLDDVELASYLNYFLPRGGLDFTAGRATLSIRLHREGRGPMQATGRAELQGGTLRIPAIQQPLEGLNGAVVFDPHTLKFQRAQASFLGATWTASGSIRDLRHPVFDLSIQGDQVPLEVLSQQVRGLALLRLSGTAAVDAQLTGLARSPRVQASLRSRRLDLLGMRLHGLSATARLEGENLWVSGLRAGMWGGSLDGSAEMGLARGGHLSAELNLQGAQLARARLDGRRPLPLAGLAQGRLVASGLLRNPRLDLRLTLPSAELGGLDLGALTAQAHWGLAGLDAQFQALRGRLSGRVAFSRGRAAAFHDSRITLRAMDISSTAAGLAAAGDSIVLPPGAVKAGALLKDRLRGRLDAAVSLAGPLRSPQVWIDARLKGGRLMLSPDGPLALRDPGAGLALFLAGAVGLHKGDIQFGRPNAPLKIVLGTRKSGILELQALGRYPLHGRGDSGHLSLDLVGDLRLLDALALFNKTRGRLSGDLLLSGTPGAPLGDGELSVQGFQTNPAAYLAPVRGGAITLQMRGQSVHLVNLKFQAGGEVNAVGEASLTQGWEGLSGSLKLTTDDKGLRFENWDSVGNGSLRLEPLVLRVDGPGSPLKVSGRVLLSDAKIVYAGPAPSVAQPGLVRATRPLALDLRVALGNNVWYDKHQTQAINFMDFDPLKWGSAALNSMARPDIYLRLAPTDRDFHVTGTTPHVSLEGELSIDQGRLTIMENEFKIKTDGQPAHIRFNGHHAEVHASAVGRLHYTRDNPATHRPYLKTVDVTVKVTPMDADTLERSDLAGAFLNYQVSYTADPPLVPDDERLNQLAVLNLLVLGDPMVDADAANADNSYMGTQLDRVLSGELRRQIAQLSQQGFKLLGVRLVDVLRIVPRFKYQSANNARPINGSAQTGGNAGLAFSDITTELGWTIGDSFYLSLQGVGYFDNSTLNSLVADMPQGPSYQVLPYGLRGGLEYQISPSRTLDLFYNYGVDDDLDLIPFVTGSSPSQGPDVRFSNSIPIDDYTPTLAEHRRFDEGLKP